MFAPSDCQAEIELLREAIERERDHPLVHKGDFFDVRTIATDDGDQNEPDFPVVLTAVIRIDAFESRKVLYRSDGKGKTVPCGA